MSLVNLIDDAAKIAGSDVPTSSELASVVGVLIKHVEQLAGHELEHLSDEALGIPAPEPAAQAQPEVTNEADQARIKELEAELAAARQAPPAPAQGATS